MGLVMLVMWIGLIAYRAFELASSLRELESRSQSVLGDGITGIRVETIEPLVLDVRHDLVFLRRDAGPLFILAPYFSWVPEVGPLISSAPELFEMADAGSQAAVSLLGGLKPAIDILNDEGGSSLSRFPELIDAISSASSSIAVAAASVDRMSAAREDLGKTSEFPVRVRSLLERFDEELPLVQDTLRLSTVVPELFGARGRRTYLIMAQNEDELRPTGGFISGAGLLVVEEGEVVSVAFSDASLVDDWRNKPYDFPPQPFFEIMGMDIFLFRDVNFWPDFPITAERAMELYTYGQDVPLDGVIAIDQHFLSMLLSSLGPLFVPEIEQTLTSQNVISEMQAQWGQTEGGEDDWIGQRKSFMGPMANAILNKLEQDIASVDLINLARDLKAAADQRHLQIYLKDPAAAAALSDSGWDGHYENFLGQDYLLVVDTSMGFNKVSAAIDREIVYQVRLQNERDPEALLEVKYTHNSRPTEANCNHGTVYTDEITYSDLLDDCYWNYVRVYAPAGSHLSGSSFNPVPADQLLSGAAWEGYARTAEEENESFQVFDNFYLIEQGERFAGEFEYILPAAVVRSSEDEKTYHLHIANQSGVGPHPIRVTVMLPGGAELLDAQPTPFQVDQQTVIFSESLASDLMFTIVYR
jgi:hypothetical protein